MDDTHQQLLQTLKSVVEGLLNCQVANVWNIYGGLSRLHSVLERIIKHEFRVFKQNGEEDCWIFIEGLNWLQPSLATSPTPISPNSPPPHPHTDKAMIWLHNSLETHSLSEKLAWLVSDEKHLISCYNERAFLRQPKYVEAALVCLRAIEQNQLSLLAEIHPFLYLSERSLRAQEKFHRRCSSFPETIKIWPKSSIELKPSAETMDSSKNSSIISKIEETKITEGRKSIKNKTVLRVKPWRSLPNLFYVCEKIVKKENPPLRKIKTEPSSPAMHAQKINPEVLKVDYGVLKENSFSIKIKRTEKIKRSDVKVDIKKTERKKKKSFIEDGGGRSIKQMSMGSSSFPKPKEGQTLTSFLSSKLFAQSNAELDRENAHFSICEAVISAIEQVKCNERESLYSDLRSWKKSSPINISSTRKSSPINISSTSTSENSTNTSPSFKTIKHDNLANNTAEMVGLNLLSKFKDQQLPKASEIQWICMDEDAPEQKLLPLLSNFKINEQPVKDVTLRGTEDWAPPRPQLILTTHPPPRRNVQMVKQSFRCAGCGMKVAPEYSHRFRYCDYLGKYFCTGCHKNKHAFIPGRILFKWDFKKYPVSDFSFNLLEHMMYDPLFNVSGLNPELYKSVKSLEPLKKMRIQLSELNDFLTHCQYYAQELEQDLEKINGHLLSDCDTYSLVDLIQIKNGELFQKVKLIINHAMNHVAKCQLCQGRGFMCEMCRLKDVIFPWQVGKVSRCSKCGSCHHVGCLRKTVTCPRCTRLANRGLTVS